MGNMSRCPHVPSAFRHSQPAGIVPLPSPHRGAWQPHITVPNTSGPATAHPSTIGALTIDAISAALLPQGVTTSCTSSPQTLLGSPICSVLVPPAVGPQPQQPISSLVEIRPRSLAPGSFYLI